MTNIFLLDNFDSFTYNLVDQFRTLGYPVRIYRNSLPATRIMQEIEACDGDAVLVLSPGPGAGERTGTASAAQAAIALMMRLAGRLVR